MFSVVRCASLIFLLLTVALFSMHASADEKSSAQAWAADVFLGKGTTGADSPFAAARPPFSFVYGGKNSREFLASWKRITADAPAGDGRQKHTITYSDPATGLEVVCEATVFADFPAVEWVLCFRNTGNVDTPILEDVRPLDVDISVPPTGAVVLHRSLGSAYAATDFMPIDEPIVAPNKLPEVSNGLVPATAEINLAPVGGRSSNAVLPFFNLQWQGGGVVGAIGWSGQWALRLRRETEGELKLQAGQQVTHLKLLPGETIRTPRILLLAWQGDDYLRGQNLFRRLLIAQYLPKRNGELAIAPIAWSSWFAYDFGNGVNEQNQLDWIDKIAKTGTEAYWLDAGWFEGGWPSGVGSWTPGAKQFPRGLRPLADAAHKAGMKFVLWFEPERADGGSQIAREHPEFVFGGKQGGLFKLSDPAARQWLTDYLSKCLDEWDVDVFRNDCNIDPVGAWRATDAPDRQGITEIRYVEGLYQLWDDLVRRRPQLMIDNCASGGRRIDLETTMRSYPLWRSDSGQDSPAKLSSHISGLSLYVPQHTGGMWAFDPYAFRSGATMGVALNVDVRAKDYSLEMAKLAIQEVKELRPLYFGDYYPLFDTTPSEREWCGWQFDRPELGRGFATVLRRPRASYVSADLALRGLDPAARYEVDFRETYATKKKRTMTGAELARLRVEIAAAPGSLLIVYRKGD